MCTPTTTVLVVVLNKSQPVGVGTISIGPKNAPTLQRVSI